MSILDLSLYYLFGVGGLVLLLGERHMADRGAAFGLYARLECGPELEFWDMDRVVSDE